MTVITVVAIAAVAAIFYAFVWPAIQDNLQGRTACSQGPNTKNGMANTEKGYVSCGTMNNSGNYTCTYRNNKNQQKTTTCTQQ